MTGKNLSRRNFMKLSSLAAAELMLAPMTARGANGQRPNILWLIVEDMSPDLACYGHPLVYSPRIDQFASEGMRFTRAYMTGAQCSPARSALMTSMYQTSIGAQQHRSHQSDGYVLPAPAKVITEYFRNAGYYTCNGRSDNMSSLGKTDWNWTYPTGAQSFDGTDWRNCPANTPFFAQVNFTLTHRPFEDDPSHPINPNAITLPPEHVDHPVSRKDWSNYLESVQLADKQVGQFLDRLDADGLTNNTIVFFFSDHGRPFVWNKQWLYEGGIKIPLIIRWPGHIQAGSVNDDLVSGIDFGPTCMQWAGVDYPDYIHGRPISGTGVRSIADTGNMRLGMKSQTHGRKYIFAARDTTGIFVGRIRAVVTKRYKYIRNFFPQRPYINNPGQHNFDRYVAEEHPIYAAQFVKYYQGTLAPSQARFMNTISPSVNRPKEELYDLENDPTEVTNLAGNPAYDSVRKHLSDRLDQWMVETKDRGDEMPTQEWEDYWSNWGANHFYDTFTTRGVDVSPFQSSPPDYEQGWKNVLAWWETELGV